MGITKYLNTKYYTDGGGYVVPLCTGDRYYAQDHTRDLRFLQSLSGDLLSKFLPKVPVLLSGGVCTQGAGFTLNITQAEALVNFSVDYPDNFNSLPPGKLTSDIVINVSLPSQTNLSISGTTNDGSTLNYVKLAYAEASGNTRARAKASGTYNYELTKSYVITTSSVAPTSYEIALATFTTNGSTITFTGTQIEVQGQPQAFIENLLLENTTTTITVKAGLKIRTANTMWYYPSDVVITPALASSNYKWGALGVNESTGQITAFALSSITTASYTTGLIEANNQLNMYFLYNNLYGYCRCTTATGTFRIICVFKQVNGFTNATVNTTNASKVCTIGSTTAISIGMTLSGAGGSGVIPANADITEITNSTTFKMNVNATGTGAVTTTTFSNQIIYITPIFTIPRTKCVLFNNDTAQVVTIATPIALPVIEFDLNSEISGATSTTRLFTTAYAGKKEVRFNLAECSQNANHVYYITKNSRSYNSGITSTSTNQNSIYQSTDIDTQKGDTLQLLSDKSSLSFNINITNYNNSSRFSYFLIEDRQAT